MNNARRKEITSIEDDIQKNLDAFNEADISAVLDEISSNLDDVLNNVEEVRDEEQLAFDSMPENAQTGDRGNDMQTAIDALTEGYDDLDQLKSDIEDLKTKMEEISTAFSDAITKINEAKGE